jgi:hypothetical protein
MTARLPVLCCTFAYVNPWYSLSALAGPAPNITVSAAAPLTAPARIFFTAVTSVTTVTGEYTAPPAPAHRR